MESRAERAAKNESLVREVNERIGETALGWQRERAAALCECQAMDCRATVEVSLEEYEAVRSHADRFLLLEGHEDPAVESIVERTDRYVVVEKVGEGAEVARELDPRA